MPTQTPDIYGYSDYRSYVRDLLKSFPKGGHGQFRRMAEALRLNVVTISQIFNGKRSLTVDQAYEVCHFLGLRDSEAEFFILLVEKSHATLPRYRQHLSQRIENLKTEARKLKKSVSAREEITDEAKARFYSDWRYSAVRLCSSIVHLQDPAKISQLLKIPSNQLMEILSFLLKYDLLQRKGGKIVLGGASTFLEAGSPFILHRQMTWRLKAHEYMTTSAGKADTQNLFFTGPCSISQKNFEEFRAELNKVIQSFISRLESEKPEQLACFNIDFFRMT